MAATTHVKAKGWKVGLLVLVLAAPCLWAKQWDGDDGSSANWNACNNWYDNTCSGVGSSEDITFMYQNSQWDSYYNYGDGDDFHTITFNSTLPHPMTLGNPGSGMDVYGDIYQNNANTMTWFPKIYFQGDRDYTIQADGGTLDFGLSSGTYFYLNANNRNLYFQGGSGKNIYVNAVIANGGGYSGCGIVVNSSGLYVLLKAVNTYDGETRVNYGTLALDGDGLISDSSGLYVDSSGTFDENGKSETVKYVAGSGSIVLGNTGGLTYGGNVSTNFSGVISGGSGATVTKNGTGAWTLSGANTYTGATLVKVGSLIMNGTNLNSVVAVAAAATNLGVGSEGALGVAGQVAPGTNMIGIGCLTVASLSMSNGSSFRCQLGDFTNALDRDVIVNTGAAPTLGGTVTIYVDSSNLSHWAYESTMSWNILTGKVASAAGFTLNETTYWDATTYPKNGGSFSLSVANSNLVLSFTPAYSQTSITYGASTTFTVPCGVTSATIECWGGGGGGSTRTTAGGGGGGGGGAYSRRVVTLVPGDNCTVTVGAGGTNNAAGGDTWFQATSNVLAKGGSSSGLNSSNWAAGGASGSCVGTTVYSGGNGANGVTGSYGGGGGSSAGTNSAGTSAVNATGATAPSGGGNGGNGKSSPAGDGSPGSVPGGGGGGGFRTTSGTRLGGAGATGQVIVTYTYIPGDDDTNAPTVAPFSTPNWLYNPGFEIGPDNGVTADGWWDGGGGSDGAKQWKYAARSGTNGIAWGSWWTGAWGYFARTDSNAYTKLSIGDVVEFRAWAFCENNFTSSTKEAYVELKFCTNDVGGDASMITNNRTDIYDTLVSQRGVWQQIVISITNQWNNVNVIKPLIGYGQAVDAGTLIGMSVFWDDIVMIRRGVSEPMEVWVGDTKYMGSDLSTNACFYIDAAALSNNSLRLVFGAYDAGSGLSRGTNDPSTQMNVDVGALCTNDVAHYVADESSPDSSGSTTTSTWTWVTISASQLAAMTNAISNRVVVTLFDNDNDRECDQSSADQQFGFLVVTTRTSYVDMDVLGNNLVIVNDDVTPSAADGTDFGTIVGAGNSRTNTFVITNSGTANLTVQNVAIRTNGGALGTFSVVLQPSSPIAGGNTTTFQIKFAPTNLGSYQAVLYITNNTAYKNPYAFLIQGDYTNAAVSVPTCTWYRATNDGNEMVRLAWSNRPGYYTLIAARATNPPSDPVQSVAYTNGTALGTNGSWVIYKGIGTNLEHVVVDGQTIYYRFYCCTNDFYSTTGGQTSVVMPAYLPDEIVDAFAYTNGTRLSGCPGGHNWTNNWFASGHFTNVTVMTVDEPIFPNMPWFPTNAANRLKMADPGANKSAGAYRNCMPFTTGTVYLSGMMCFKNEGGNKWCAFSVMNGTNRMVNFGETAGSASWTDASLGMWGGYGWTNGLGQNTMPAWGEGRTDNTYCVIARYTFETRLFELMKFNRTNEIPLTVPATWTMSTTLPESYLTRIDGLGIYAGASAAGSSIEECFFDELRIARSWDQLLNNTNPPTTTPPRVGTLPLEIRAGKYNTAMFSDSFGGTALKDAWQWISTDSCTGSVSSALILNPVTSWKQAGVGTVSSNLSWAKTGASMTYQFTISQWNLAVSNNIKVKLFLAGNDTRSQPCTYPDYNSSNVVMGLVDLWNGVAFWNFYVKTNHASYSAFDDTVKKDVLTAATGYGTGITYGFTLQGDVAQIWARLPNGAYTSRPPIIVTGMSNWFNKSGTLYAGVENDTGSDRGAGDNVRLSNVGAMLNVLDGELTSSAPMRLVFGAYDVDAGLSRGTTDAATQMNVDVGTWLTDNVTNYAASESSSDANTTNSTATNTWLFNALDVGALMGTNAIQATLRDSSGLSTANQEYAYLQVSDDDTNAPVAFGNRLQNPGFEILATNVYSARHWAWDCPDQQGDHWGNALLWTGGGALNGSNSAAFWWLDVAPFNYDYGGLWQYVTNDTPAGTIWLASAWYRRDSAWNASGYGIKIEQYNAAGTCIKTNETIFTASADAWTNVSVVATAQAAAVWIRFVSSYWGYSGSGNIMRMDDAFLAPSWPMKAYIGTTNYPISDATTNGVITLTDGSLLGVSAANPLKLVLPAYDVGSGLSRGTSGSSTQMNLDFGSWLTDNVTNYDDTLSTPYASTFAAGATSTWKFVNVPGTLVMTTNKIAVTVPDNDVDRANDRVIVTNQQFGYIVLGDDDTDYPLGGNLLKNPGFEIGSAGGGVPTDWWKYENAGQESYAARNGTNGMVWQCWAAWYGGFGQDVYVNLGVGDVVTFSIWGLAETGFVSSASEAWMMLELWSGGTYVGKFASNSVYARLVGNYETWNEYSITYTNTTAGITLVKPMLGYGSAMGYGHAAVMWDDASFSVQSRPLIVRVHDYYASVINDSFDGVDLKNQWYWEAEYGTKAGVNAGLHFWPTNAYRQAAVGSRHSYPWANNAPYTYQFTVGDMFVSNNFFVSLFLVGNDSGTQPYPYSDYNNPNVLLMQVADFDSSASRNWGVKLYLKTDAPYTTAYDTSAPGVKLLAATYSLNYVTNATFGFTLDQTNVTLFVTTNGSTAVTVVTNLTAAQMNHFSDQAYVHVAGRNDNGAAVSGEHASLSNVRVQPACYAPDTFDYIVTDGDLAYIDATHPFRMVFPAYDVGSGLSRGIADASTQMNVTVVNLATNNTTNYVSSESSALSDTMSIAGSNIWRWTSFDSTRIQGLMNVSPNPILATLRDADSDRANDQLSVTNVQFGLLQVVDDDEDSPRFSGMDVTGGSRTNLRAGQVVVVTYQSATPDKFSFVPLVDLVGGTVVKFTDCGWVSGSGFRSGEGMIVWTSPAGWLWNGTVVTITNADAATPIPSTGTLSKVAFGGSFDLSTSGDQLLMYQDTATSTTFLFAVEADSTGWGNATDTATTALPPGLTDGLNAVNIASGTERDNGYYDGDHGGSTYSLGLSISAVGNWTTSDNLQTSSWWCSVFNPDVYVEFTDESFASGISITGLVVDGLSGLYRAGNYGNSPTATVYDLAGAVATGKYFTTGPATNGSGQADAAALAVSSLVLPGDISAVVTVKVVATDYDVDRTGDSIASTQLVLVGMSGDDDTNRPAVGAFQPGNQLRNPSFEMAADLSAFKALYWCTEDRTPNLNAQDIFNGGDWGTASREGWGSPWGTYVGAVRGTWCGVGTNTGGFWQQATNEAGAGAVWEASAYVYNDVNWTCVWQAVFLEFYDAGASNLLSAKTNVFANPGTTWTRVSVTGAAPAGAVYARWVLGAWNVTTGAGGALSVDAVALRVVTNTVMDFMVGDRSFYRSGYGSNALFRVTDGDLASASPTSLMKFVFNVYDTPSGLQRSTATSNALNYDVGTEAQLQNIYQTYSNTLSAADTTVGTSTSVFAHVTGFTRSFQGSEAGQTGMVWALMGWSDHGATNRVNLSGPDADNDRTNDSLWLVDAKFGDLWVSDDDTNGPFHWLQYVGTNFTWGSYSTNPISDEDMRHGLDIVYGLWDDSGLMVTNTTPGSTNVNGDYGNICPNWDLVRPDGAGFISNSVPSPTNILSPKGNGSYNATVMVQNIDISYAQNTIGTWRVQGSAEDWDRDRGWFLRTNLNSQVETCSWDRMWSSDWRMDFIVYDDDDDPPLLRSFGSPPSTTNPALLLFLGGDPSLGFGSGSNVWWKQRTYITNAIEVFRVTDENLANVSAGSPLDFKIWMYDQYGRIARDTILANRFTNTSLTIGSAIVSNVANFEPTISCTYTQTASLFTGSNYWRWTSFTDQEITDLYNAPGHTNMLQLHVFNDDHDRIGDQEHSVTNLGWLMVTDDDTIAPIASDLKINGAFPMVTNISDQQLRSGDWIIELTISDQSGVNPSWNGELWPANYNLITPNGVTVIVEKAFDAYTVTGTNTTFSRNMAGDVAYTSVVLGVYTMAWSALDLDDDRTGDGMTTLTSHVIYNSTNVVTVVDDDTVAPTPPTNVIVTPTSWTNVNYFTMTFSPGSDLSGIYQYRADTNWGVPPTTVTNGIPLNSASITSTLPYVISNGGFEVGYNMLQVTEDPNTTNGWTDYASEGAYTWWSTNAPQLGSNCAFHFLAEGNQSGNGEGRFTLCAQDVYLNNTSDLPLLVNYSGWFKGNMSITGWGGVQGVGFLKMEFFSASTARIRTVDNEWYTDENGWPLHGTNITSWSNVVLRVTNGPAQTEFIRFSCGLATHGGGQSLTGYWDNLSMTVRVVNIAGMASIFTNAAEGSNSVWLFSVDDDDDRVGDRLKSANTNFTILFDTTTPVRVTNVVAVAGTNDDMTEIWIDWDRLYDGGGASLSPWQTYAIYYTTEARQPTNTDPFVIYTNGYANLSNITVSALLLTNMPLGEDVRVAVAGKDWAGNIGPLSTNVVSVTLGALYVTQGVLVASINGPQIAWTATNKSGVIVRNYDLIYCDAMDFHQSLTTAWSLIQSVSNSWAQDTGSATRTPPLQMVNTMRFYRAAAEGQWQTTRSPRVASAEIYGHKTLRFYRGQNWVGLPFVPDSNCVKSIFGYGLPGSNSAAYATRITWYSNVMSTNAKAQIWLSKSAGSTSWQYSVGGSGSADTMPLDIMNGFIIEIPTNASQPQVLPFIGRLPTNTTTGVVAGASAFNVLNFRSPRRLHPAQMNLSESGFKGGRYPMQSDRIWSLNRETQRANPDCWLDTSGTPTWRLNWTPTFPEVPTNYFNPDDAVIIRTSPTNANWIWTNKLLYPLPTRNMTP